ncbi:MAG: hypothetical protein PHS16_03060 [Candidatus Colwellbacteria bacterium]|nr:hypothetical protein [Candidatus Colwellbacteria bacterium]
MWLWWHFNNRVGSRLKAFILATLYYLTQKPKYANNKIMRKTFLMLMLPLAIPLWVVGGSKTVTITEEITKEVVEEVVEVTRERPIFMNWNQINWNQINWNQKTTPDSSVSAPRLLALKLSALKLSAPRAVQ